jgi:23S rRNA pseudouridine2605 synthase
MADRGAGAGRDDRGGAGIRLQKVLAAAGIGSRRHSEELIAAGRVRVDGVVVREQGRRVDPETAVIEVDGERVVTRAGTLYLALNKPPGVLSSMSDDRGRPTVADFLVEFDVSPSTAGRGGRPAGAPAGLFHVGRLDAESEGLLLVTNDGELGHRLAHPSFGVAKTYLVEVSGPVRRELPRRLRKGVDLDDGPVSVDEARVVDAAASRVLVEITLHEGRKHVVRRLMAAVGHPVHRLVRIRIGPVSLGTLKPGRVRHLTRHEIAALYRAAGLC